MKKGISLLLLIVIIIVITILTSSIMLAIVNNNPIGKASEASFKSTAQEYNIQMDMKAITSFANGSSIGNLEVPSSDIKDYIPVIKSSDTSKYNIQNGELAYIGTDINEGKWINEMNILNGNPPKLQTIKVPNVSTDSESMGSSLATSNEEFITITSSTISSQRHSYINLLDKDYNLIKRVDVYLGINTYFREMVLLSNGNIAVAGYTLDASNNINAIMFLYSPNLDELKREIYSAPKSGYVSWGRNIVNTSTGGYMIINSAERYNAAKTAITDAYASIYSYDANGNSILNNIEVRGLDNSLFLVYDAVLYPNGNIYLCGNNYKYSKATPNVIGINKLGQVIYEYIVTTTDPYGEYRYMCILSDGTLVLDRIGCKSISGNPYESAIETIDYLNVSNNQINNVSLSIPQGLPKILDVSTGYGDNVLITCVESSLAPEIYTYKIYKLSETGDIRWSVVGKNDQTNVILKIQHPEKNKYIVFGQYKENSTSQYAAYVSELIP